ncbi:MAG: OsmC family protein [Planctomycetota bacterium]|nr:OsmC family protein [Planctomycetota bacterium]
MVEMDVSYQGDLHCSAAHAPSGNTIVTDAPRDNQGRGEAFSPTDLIGAALGTCILTIMGIYARRHSIDISGATAHVTKEMASAPARRVGKLAVTVNLPGRVPQEHRQAMERAARACPVGQSLHPELEQAITFVYAG